MWDENDEAAFQAVMASFVIVSMHPRLEDLMVFGKGGKWLQRHRVELHTKLGNVAFYETEALAQARIGRIRTGEMAFQARPLNPPHHVRVITYRELGKLIRRMRKDGECQIVREYLKMIYA